MAEVHLEVCYYLSKGECLSKKLFDFDLFLIWSHIFAINGLKGYIARRTQGVKAKVFKKKQPNKFF